MIQNHAIMISKVLRYSEIVSSSEGKFGTDLRIRTDHDQSFYANGLIAERESNGR